MSFFNELKRRHVFRVGGAYLVVAWVLAQVSDLIADNLDFPGWFMPMVLAALGLGFPVALVIAWALQRKPDGIVRDPRESDPPEALPIMQQNIQFCQASDGVQLAYATTGVGPVLVKAATWMTNLEDDFKSSLWGHIIRDISGYRQLIRFDQRGNGLSDRTVETISPARFSSDLEDVINAAGVDKCALLGISQGSAAAIEFAVKYPDRVTHLVLLGSFAHGVTKFGGEKARAQLEVMKEMMRVGWGQRSSTFRRVFTAMFVPSVDPAIADEFDQMQSTTTSAETAVRLLQAISDIDVDDLLEKVRVPTLVLHCKGDLAISIKEGRFIASKIPHARFVMLESDNHVPIGGEPAAIILAQEIRAFLTDEKPSSVLN